MTRALPWPCSLPSLSLRSPVSNRSALGAPGLLQGEGGLLRPRVAGPLCALQRDVNCAAMQSDSGSELVPLAAALGWKDACPGAASGPWGRCPGRCACPQPTGQRQEGQEPQVSTQPPCVPTRETGRGGALWRPAGELPSHPGPGGW